MPTQAEFEAGMANLRQAIADAATRVINDLQSKLAAGDPITEADLQEILDATQEAAGIDPVAPTPAPPTP